MNIGQKLKDKRTQAGLTQEAVAEKIGVSRQTVSSWENNRSYPDIVSILRLSDLYEVSLDEFLKEDADMRKHVEENAQTLKKIWNVLSDLCVLLLVVAIFMQSFHWDATAYLLYGLSAVFYTVLRLLVPKLFGHSWKLELLRIAEQLLLIAWLAFSPYRNDFIPWSWTTDLLHLSILVMLLPLSHYLVTQEKKAGYATDTSAFSRAPWSMKALVLTIPLLLFISDSDSLDSIPDPNPYAPFPDTYQVAEVIHTSDPNAVPPLVTLMQSTRLHATDPLASGKEIYGILYLQDPETQKLEKIGDLTELEIPAGDNILKGIWQTTPEEDSNLIHQVTVEADESVTISCYQADSLQWKYLLRPTDRLKVFWKASPNLMSIFESGYFNADWFPAGETYDISSLGEIETLGKLSVTLTPNYPADTLTVYEDYYHEGELTTIEMTIQPDENGIFSLKPAPYHDSGSRCSVYRIPFNEGEFVFVVNFP